MADESKIEEAIGEVGLLHEEIILLRIERKRIAKEKAALEAKLAEEAMRKEKEEKEA